MQDSMIPMMEWEWKWTVQWILSFFFCHSYHPKADKSYANWIPYHLPCFLLYKAFFYVAYSCVIVWLHIIRFYLARDKEPWTCRKSFMCLLVTYIFLDLPFKAKCCDWFSFKYPFVSWFKNAKGNNFIIVIGSRV